VTAHLNHSIFNNVLECPIRCFNITIYKTISFRFIFLIYSRYENWNISKQKWTIGLSSFKWNKNQILPVYLWTFFLLAMNHNPDNQKSFVLLINDYFNKKKSLKFNTLKGYLYAFLIEHKVRTLNERYHDWQFSFPFMDTFKFLV